MYNYLNPHELFEALQWIGLLIYTVWLFDKIKDYPFQETPPTYEGGRIVPPTSPNVQRFFYFIAFWCAFALFGSILETVLWAIGSWLWKNL